ncbi:alpha/beta-hydrolase [Auriscalpium vulgare]|uniref:Alpha/beta-hydrolase n=1 Tax=Auriscalpium vulgare TaxID=40419 RepID=A0ACB8R715_9AGAM|nr:alpha/beta-hydrolase [Auriscalpium vulgare]
MQLYLRSYLLFLALGLVSSQQQAAFNTPKPLGDGSSALKTDSDTFTAQDLVELPRPGIGTANRRGDLVLVPISKYTYEDNTTNHTLVIESLTIPTEQIVIPLPRSAEALWLDDRSVGYVLSDPPGDPATLFVVVLVWKAPRYLALPPVRVGTFPNATPANFQYTTADTTHGVLVFTDHVYPDGNLSTVWQQDEAWAARRTSVRVYEDAYERYWDAWRGPKRQSLFGVALWRDRGRERWHMGEDYVNVLNGTGHHPGGVSGGKNDFAVSDRHIVYTTRVPGLQEALHTKQDIYIVGFDGEPPRQLTSGKQAGTLNPVFNPDFDKVAWLETDVDGNYASHRNIVIYDLRKNIRYTLTQSWDRDPGSLAFSSDSSILYFTAGDHARTLVFALHVPPTPPSNNTHIDLPPFYTTPQAITHAGTATGLQSLPNLVYNSSRLLFMTATLQSPSDVMLLHDVRSVDGKIAVHGESQRVTRFTERLLEGKELVQPEDFYFEGARGKRVHGILMKPKGWKEGQKKKYPVMLAVHGGPQGVWDHTWSYRWNFNIFANQGYFVVGINPTGSLTFGQDFKDGTRQDWGGKTFVDLVNGWKYVLEKHPEIDADRAVAAGASFGGYAMNWIQGHPEYGFNFKAQVCHDGMFDLGYAGYAIDELMLLRNDYGLPWEAETKALFAKHSPHQFVDKWATPMLVIHGSKDYRLPETEGLSAFHALKMRGVPTRLLIFPDEGHFVQGPANSVEWHREVFRWFEMYVGKKAIEA